MIRILLTAVMACLVMDVAAKDNDISWRYDVDYYQLANGMKVTMKQVDREDNVSIQIVVGYGSDDEPCGKRETAHFLEHLLFTGTQEYNEATLEKMATSYGAQWNAFTEFDRTIFFMNVHSDNAEKGLSLLQKILTESTITAENVDKSRKIIHREAGGERSAVTQFFYEHGLMKSAANQMLNDNNHPSACRQIEQADSITRDDILNAYNTWYVPNNMHIYVVGNFNKSMKDQINALFGNLQSKALPQRIDKTMQQPAKYEYRSKMMPLYADETEVIYWYLLPPLDDTDFFSGILLMEYLNEKFYEAIRINAGLAYDPSVSYYSYIYHGSFTFSATVNNNDVGKLRSEIEKFLTETINNGISQDDLDRVRNSALSYMSQGDPDNDGLASFYIDSLARFDNAGKFDDTAVGLKNVSTNDIKRFIDTYLSKRPVVLLEKPTMSVRTFWILVIGFPLSLTLAVGWTIWRMRKRREVKGGLF